MRLMQKPNRWSCGITSFAMLFDLSIEEAIQLLGHDGSAIWWPNASEPLCRRGYSISEFVDAAILLGFALIQIDVVPALVSPKMEPKRIYDEQEMEVRLSRFLNMGEGLILGQHSADAWHMVAWDGSKVFDPDEPRCYSFDEPGVNSIMVDTFWLKRRIL